MFWLFELFYHNPWALTLFDTAASFFTNKPREFQTNVPIKIDLLLINSILIHSQNRYEY